MAEVIDLDELLGADKKVKLRGKTYILPPDLPADLYLQVVKMAASEASEADMIEALYNQLLELFSYKTPVKTLPLTVSQCVTAVAKIYGESEPAGNGSRPRGTRGARSSKTRRTA